jgi:hypothetical protein
MRTEVYILVDILLDKRVDSVELASFEDVVTPWVAGAEEEVVTGLRLPQVLDY